MVAQVARVETTVTRSEGEALLLENNLIKSHEPRYNILFRDDKSYPVRLPHRRSVPAAALPSRPARQARTATSARFRAPAPCARAWRCCRRCSSFAPARTRCSPTARGRACCTRSSAAAGRASGSSAKPTTARTSQGAVLFLQGKADEVLAQLQAADGRGRARRWRSSARRGCATRSRGSQRCRSRQFVESATAGDIDVVAAATEQGLVAVNVVMIRGGRHVGDRTFFPQHADAGELAEVVTAFLEQHYVERPVPPTIIVPAADDHAALAEVLSAQSGQRVEIVDNPGGERRVWLAMARAERGLRDPAEARAEGDAGRPARGAAGRRSGLPPSAQRIECFDVSHTMGEASGRVVRDLRPARDADVRVPPVQRRAAARRATTTPRCARR